MKPITWFFLLLLLLAPLNAFSDDEEEDATFKYFRFPEQSLDNLWQNDITIRSYYSLDFSNDRQFGVGLTFRPDLAIDPAADDFSLSPVDNLGVTPSTVLGDLADPIDQVFSSYFSTPKMLMFYFHF